jgi:23S rRNA G2069 N7-methylase RlmK/C1962 C5-methylase RlmI
MNRPYPALIITPKGERSIRAGHPWVYHTEITQLSEPVENGALVWLESGIVCRNVTVENVYRNERNVTTKAPTVRISENVQAENLQIKNIHNTFAGDTLVSVENNSDQAEIILED